MADRKKELLNCFKNFGEDQRKLIDSYIDRIIILEKEMLFWEKQPKYKVHPEDKTRVKETEANKIYLKYVQQYNVAIKILLSQFKNSDVKEESPLRLYIKNLEKETR